MRNRRRRVNTGNEKTLASQLLGLSLFIMLLAFFIILNAISSFEEAKVSPIINSLGSTFASKILPSDENRPSMTESDEKSVNEGDTLDRMKALFTSHIPGQKSAMNKTRGELTIRVPYSELEEAILSIGQTPGTGEKPQGGFFLPTLVALVKGDQSGMTYRMDMLLDVPGNPAKVQNEEPRRMAAMMKQMSRLAERLESAGLQQKLVSIGVQEGEADMVDIYFRRHVPFNPLGDKYDNE